MCRREWTTVCAAFCVRGPRWSTGRIFCTGVDEQPEPEHLGDLLGRGFQPVQGGVAPGSERGAARLTSKGLDPFSLAMLAIANKGMNGSVCNAEVKTLSVGTGEALCVHALGGSTAAFHL